MTSTDTARGTRIGSGKAVVLLSGGVDSSTALAIAKAEGHKLYALSFDYNQRHRIELEAAKAVAAAVGVIKHLIVRFDLREIGGSALTSEIDVPKHGSVDDRSSSERDSSEQTCYRTTGLIPVTYVPARNTIFLAFAVAWAEVLEANDIFVGANAVDYSGYPDCRPEYLKAFENMANLATKATVEGKLRFAIKAPLIFMKKSEIIQKGIELGLDYSLTWSCYDPQDIGKHGCAETREPKEDEGTVVLPGFRSRYKPCGLCDSCRIRTRGFKEAGIGDQLS
jgi:7-cyano-7-deazaguanine synthase